MCSIKTFSLLDPINLSLASPTLFNFLVFHLESAICPSYFFKRQVKDKLGNLLGINGISFSLGRSHFISSFRLCNTEKT